MRLPLSLVLATLCATGAAAHAQDKAKPKTLLDKRKGHKTKIVNPLPDDEKVIEEPPASIFSLVKYRSPAGMLGAYVSVPPKPDTKGPAIIWITGGFPVGGAGSSAWERASADNDQSAAIYRRSGIVMMFPTTRGTQGNPGKRESFLGEVDDIIAAADYLAKQPFVDPKQIYLGGHSTGGTMVMLVAESTNKFRAVFSFGPKISAGHYGAEVLAYDPDDNSENRFRSPLLHTECITSPTWVIEGDQSGNHSHTLDFKQHGSDNKNLHCVPIVGANHFNVLAPINRYIAKKILELKPGATIALSNREMQSAFREQHKATREADALSVLASLRRARVDFSQTQTVRHYFYTRERKVLDQAAARGKIVGMTAEPIQSHKSEDGRAYFELILTKKLRLDDLDAVFRVAESIQKIETKFDLQYDGWNVK